MLELGDGDSRIRALDDVSLAVMPGEFLAIVGPSGSGKSSLLTVAGALGQPDSGTVRVHGTDLGTLSRRARTRFRLHNIGFVFQSGNLLPALTAADQLRHSRARSWRGKSTTLDRAGWWRINSAIGGVSSQSMRACG